MESGARAQGGKERWASLADGLPDTSGEIAREIMAALKTDGYACLALPVSLEHHELVAAQIGEVMSRSDVKVDRERAVLQERTRVVKGRPGPYGSDLMAFHTDNIRVDVLSMYCIEQDEIDGAILLLDTGDLAEHFSPQEIACLSSLELLAPPVTAPGQEREDLYYQAPLISKSDDGYRVYYIPWLVPDWPDSASREMLTRFSDYLKNKEETQLIRLPIEKQESVFINNHRMLHGRGALTENSKRYMLRHYISVPSMSCRSAIKRLQPAAADQAVK